MVKLTKLTNGVVSGLLALIANGNIASYQEALVEFVGGQDVETKKRQCASFQQVMRGLWNNERIKLSKEEGDRILGNIINQLQEFLKESELKKFNLVVFKELINWAEAGYSQSLALDAKARAEELKIEIGPSIAF